MGHAGHAAPDPTFGLPHDIGLAVAVGWGDWNFLCWSHLLGEAKMPLGPPPKSKGWRCDHCLARLTEGRSHTMLFLSPPPHPAGPHSQSGSCQTATSPAGCWVWEKTTEGSRVEAAGPRRWAPGRERRARAKDPQPGTAGEQRRPRWSPCEPPSAPAAPVAADQSRVQVAWSGAASSWRSPCRSRCPRPARAGEDTVEQALRGHPRGLCLRATLFQLSELLAIWGPGEGGASGEAARRRRPEAHRGR